MTQSPRTTPRRHARLAPGAAVAAVLVLLAAPGRAQPAPAPPPAAAAPAGAPVTTAPGNVGAQKNVTVLGLGMMSCEGYAALQQAGAGDIVNQWLLGFLSGGGAFAGSNYLGGTGIPDALKLVQHYCAGNPKASLAVAGLEVAQELEGPLGQMRHR
ncbi:MAG: hypothetical protein ACRYGC_03065 [Janthinobacterium lividum]